MSSHWLLHYLFVIINYVNFFNYLIQLLGNINHIFSFLVCYVVVLNIIFIVGIEWHAIPVFLSLVQGLVLKVTVIVAANLSSSGKNPFQFVKNNIIVSLNHSYWPVGQSGEYYFMLLWEFVPQSSRLLRQKGYV